MKWLLPLLLLVGACNEDQNKFIETLSVADKRPTNISCYSGTQKIYEGTTNMYYTHSNLRWIFIDTDGHAIRTNAVCIFTN